MTESRAITYVQEWIKNFSASKTWKFEGKKYGLLNGFKWVNPYIINGIIIFDEEFGICVLDHMENLKIHFNVPDDLQTTCALLSYFVDEVPITFNRKEHEYLTSGEIDKIIYDLKENE